MTITFKGKITGNNLRKDFSDYNKVATYDASTVEFQTGEGPFKNTWNQFEIEGRYPIGSDVHFEMSIVEPPE